MAHGQRNTADVASDQFQTPALLLMNWGLDQPPFSLSMLISCPENSDAIESVSSLT